MRTGNSEICVYLGPSVVRVQIEKAGFMGTIQFGTDGWRAVIAEDFTFSNVELVAQATADYWSAHPVQGTEKRVLVGYDRRFLSDKFGERTAEVFAGNGFEAVLTPGPTPTPALFFAVKRPRGIGGGVVTPPP